MIDQDKMRALAKKFRIVSGHVGQFRRHMLDDYRDAADAIDLLLAECALLRSRTNILSDLVGDLRSQRRAYASEFPMHEDGEPDEGRVHENIRKLKAELEAAAANKRENLTGDRLTDQKAAHIMQRDGYKLTGVVLCRDDGARCIVESSAVRWLTKDESWALMHPDDRRAPASEGEQK